MGQQMRIAHAASDMKDTEKAARRQLGNAASWSARLSVAFHDKVEAVEPLRCTAALYGTMPGRGSRWTRLLHSTSTLCGPGSLPVTSVPLLTSLPAA